MARTSKPGAYRRRIRPPCLQNLYFQFDAWLTVPSSRKRVDPPRRRMTPYLSRGHAKRNEDRASVQTTLISFGLESGPPPCHRKVGRLLDIGRLKCLSF